MLIYIPFQVPTTQLPTRLLPMGAPCLANVVKGRPPKKKAELQLGDKRKAEKESLGSCRSIKLRYSEKAKIFGKNHPLCFDITK